MPYEPLFLAEDSAPISPSEAVSSIELQVKPVVTWATDWGINTAFAMLGIALFYQVVILLVKPDK